jgi:uncharacterized protein YfdQ (DUF2303 family)
MQDNYRYHDKSSLCQNNSKAVGTGYTNSLIECKHYHLNLINFMPKITQDSVKTGT